METHPEMGVCKRVLLGSKPVATNAIDSDEHEDRAPAGTACGDGEEVIAPSPAVECEAPLYNEEHPEGGGRDGGRISAAPESVSLWPVVDDVEE